MKNMKVRTKLNLILVLVILLVAFWVLFPSKTWKM